MKRILFCFLLLTGICLSGSTGQDQSAGYAAIDFLVSDIAFRIVNKSAWHMNTILMFSNKG